MLTRLTVKSPEAPRRSFAAKLVLVKAEAGQLGLYRTLQSLDAATDAVGWEIADMESGKQGDPVAKAARP